MPVFSNTFPPLPPPTFIFFLMCLEFLIRERISNALSLWISLIQGPAFANMASIHITYDLYMKSFVQDDPSVFPGPWYAYQDSSYKQNIWRKLGIARTTLIQLSLGIKNCLIHSGFSFSRIIKSWLFCYGYLFLYFEKSIDSLYSFLPPPLLYAIY